MVRSWIILRPLRVRSPPSPSRRNNPVELDAYGRSRYDRYRAGTLNVLCHGGEGEYVPSREPPIYGTANADVTLCVTCGREHWTHTELPRGNEPVPRENRRATGRRARGVSVSAIDPPENKKQKKTTTVAFTVANTLTFVRKKTSETGTGVSIEDIASSSGTDVERARRDMETLLGSKMVRTSGDGVLFYPL